MKDFGQKHPIICAVFIIIWGSITFSCGVAICIILKELSFIILILFLLSGFLIIDGIVKIKKETRNKHIHYDHDLINYAQKQLDEAKRLSEIVNTTINEDEFLTTFNEICKILEDLTQYEEKIPFESPPSKNLKTICDNVDKTIAFFKERAGKNEFHFLPEQPEQEIEKDLISKNIITTNAEKSLEQKHEAPISFPIISSIVERENKITAEAKPLPQKPKIKRMSRYEMERFAIECNAYTIREERKNKQIEEQNNNQDKSVLSFDLPVCKQENLEEQNYDNMDGHQFEHYCAELLKANNFKNIEVTQGSGDHGIDILAEKDGITYAIQCKCYSSNIGNAAVQQAYTGKGFYHKDIAVVLTNRYFTPQAKEEAQALGVKLWNRDKLNELISNQGR